MPKLAVEEAINRVDIQLFSAFLKVRYHNYRHCPVRHFDPQVHVATIGRPRESKTFYNDGLVLHQLSS